ncbi:helix-turn-helix domain-containing protein [bacterium]|nr:helix-turn-helix domain-containing protein [bacterium]
MESHEVLKASLDEVGIKMAAHKLGLSQSMIYKWCQPDGDDGARAVNPLDRVLELVQLTKNTALLEWLCQEAGGYYVANPPTRLSSPVEVLQATQRMVSEFSQLLASVTHSLSDDQAISAEEAKEIRRIWQNLKSVGEYFVASSEAGRFRV